MDLSTAKLWINGLEKKGAYLSEGGICYPDRASVKVLAEEVKKAKAEDCLSRWKENGILHATYNPVMKGAPVKLQRIDNKVDITIHLSFYGTIAGNRFVEIDCAGTKTVFTKTYADIALEGIKRVWRTNTFCRDANNYFGDDKSITVNFTINHVDESAVGPHLRIKIKQSGQPICWYNVLWNMSGKQNTGAISDITLCAFFRRHVWERAFQNQAAHEIGHALGLGDAYDGITQKSPSRTDLNVLAEVPLNEVMRSNWKDAEVNANTMEMILEAFKTNKLQRFDPRAPSHVIRSYSNSMFDL